MSNVHDHLKQKKKNIFSSHTVDCYMFEGWKDKSSIFPKSIANERPEIVRNFVFFH